MIATELRLGNYVIVDNYKYHPYLKDIPLKVISVSDSRNNQHSIELELVFKNKPPFYGTYAQWDKYIIGIPLTEEWLLNFGLEKMNRVDLGRLNPCYCLFSLAIMVRQNSFFIDWIGGNTHIKYVHQLQNLYFALTGEELELKTT